MADRAGFYGKLPSHGDFLSRRLSRQFIEPWDQWLQGGLAASREQLGKGWLDTFLFSPVWQFALAPGICGGDAWAGVVMPSVDKVGRYFPLTLAAKVNDCRLSRLFDPGCGWFAALSQLALSTLEYDFDLQAFDEQLECISLADFLALEHAATKPVMFSGSGRLAFQFLLDSGQDTPQAFVELGNKLCDQFLAGCSYWRAAETEDAKSALLLCEGLPPIDAYIGFLNGEWPQRGWRFSSSRVGSAHAGIVVDSNNSPDLMAGFSASLVLTANQPLLASYSGEDREAVADGYTDVGGRATQGAVADDYMDVGDRATQGAVAENLTQTETPLEEKASEWESCALSVVGLRRKLNEDAILDRADAGMWAVADGMGGHSAGDVASQALVKALAQIPPIDDLEHYSEQVAACLHNVNCDLQQLAESRGYGQIIGSTIVVLLIAGKEFRYLWAGDSRLYLYRQGTLTQLTADHSLYNESISLGLSPLDGSLEQGRGNVITRAVGADTQLRLDFGQGQIAAQDVFILCSDGIDKELSHAEIAALCATGTAHDIAHSLVQQAEDRGGRDNISVIVIKAVNGKQII